MEAERNTFEELNESDKEDIKFTMINGNMYWYYPTVNPINIEYHKLIDTPIRVVTKEDFEAALKRLEDAHINYKNLPNVNDIKDVYITI